MQNSISKILAVSLISAVATTASAEDKSVTVVDRVMVIGNPENVKDITGSAHYIDDQNLDQNNYGDINRVLRQVPGVNLQEEEGYGNRPNIGIRGGRSERSADVTLMEDGILIAPAPYSAPSAYYFPRVSRMEGVEVRKGSSTVKFGPRTTSGVVNLISSSTPNEGKGKALLGYGEDNTQRAHLKYGDKWGRFSYVVDLGHESTDGFKDIDIAGGDTGFSIQDAMLKFKFSSPETADIYQSIEFKVGATEEDSDETYLGLTEDDFAANPYRRYAASQKDNMDADHQQFHIRHYIEPTDTLDITTTFYQNNFARNWYKLQSVTVAGTKTSLSSSLSNASALAALKGQTNLDGSATNNLTIRANNREYYSSGIQTNIAKQFSFAGTQNKLEFGARYHYDEEDRFQQEDRYSITNGIMALTNAGVPGSNANRIGSAQATALFIQDDISFGKWNLVPGIRYENIKLKRDNRSSGGINHNDLDVFVPGIGVGYKVSNNLNLFGGVHKGFAPPGPSSNESQKEEESINYEAGARYNQGAFSTEVVGYFNDYDNLLGEETLSSGGAGSGEQYNGGEVDVYGVELSASYDLAKLIKTKRFKLPISANYTYTQAEFQSSFASSFSEWGTVTSGDELPYIPEHQFFISAGIEDYKWKAAVAAKYIDEMRTTAGSGSIPSGQGTDEHIVLDFASEYEIHKNTNVFFNVDNLLDEEYVASRRPAGARPGKPRTVMAGFKLKF